MSLHTPRRRISSRTRRRCRVIKDFFCRALGQSSKTSSQRKDKIHSSIELSISDLKQKISGIETQLEKISKHCNDFTSPDFLPFIKCEDKLAVRDNSNPHVTKILYTATSSKYKKSDESDNALRNCFKSNRRIKSAQYNPNSLELQHENIRSDDDDNRVRQPCREKHRYNNEAASKLANIRYTVREFPNINISGYSNHKKMHSKKVLNRSEIVMKEPCRDFINIDKKRKMSKGRDSNRRKYSELDEKYISDIIRTQYKPVRLFGRRTSDFSQISAPACRDREVYKSNKMYAHTNLCSCCFDKCRKRDYKKIHGGDDDMRSICDARLYSSKRRAGHKKFVDDYNNSEYYDLVPVKEKSSPKSRRKFDESSRTTRYNYVEVPPCPKTQRPRLNLKTKIYDNCDEIKPFTSTHDDYKNAIYNDNDGPHEMFSGDMTIIKGNKKKTTNNFDRNIKYDNKTVYLTSNDSASNKNECSDKTLDEIKDLLQSFLTVIKKDSILNENERISSKSVGNTANEVQGTSNTTNVPLGFNNYSGGNAACNIPPIMPIYPNTCCYPIMPVYPLNYMQNGCPFTNSSSPLNLCPSNTKKHKERSSSCNNIQDEGKHTQELIKEIYDIVRQSSKSFNKHSIPNKNRSRSTVTKDFTARSVGNSSMRSKCNPDLRQSTPMCFSKSCEALGTRRETFHHSKASFSETVLGGLSIEVTHSSTELEFESCNNKDQIKENKTKTLKDILRPWKWGKKKREIIDDSTESESSIEIDIQNEAPPFRQDIFNYAMHNQEFHHSLPMYGANFNNPLYYPNNLRHPNFGNPSEYPRKQQQQYPRVTKQRRYSKKHNYDRFDHRPQFPSSSYHDNPVSAPYQTYDPNYGQMPQVPLCLKEIEVKSMGTQSERKVSLLNKLRHKVNVRDVQQQYKKLPVIPPVKAKSGMFNWQKLKENAKQGMGNEFSAETKKNLNRGDAKMRNAMLKKIFFKRNPFSPRNLILKTLLGNDPSSYGNPPKFTKPKMFM